jgi:hypothetical protein
MYVDPNMGLKVWMAIQDYQKHSPRPVRDAALNRWRRVCGVDRMAIAANPVAASSAAQTS